MLKIVWVWIFFSSKTFFTFLNSSLKFSSGIVLKHFYVRELHRLSSWKHTTFPFIFNPSQLFCLHNTQKSSVSFTSVNGKCKAKQNKHLFATVESEYDKIFSIVVSQIKWLFQKWKKRNMNFSLSANSQQCNAIQTRWMNRYYHQNNEQWAPWKSVLNENKNDVIRAK